jgi:hypothetical protein
MASKVVKTQEDNGKTYMQMSKNNIDKFTSENNYKKAFALLILVLERLNDNEKVEFIDYYSKKLNELFFVERSSHLEDRRFTSR